MAKDIRAIFTKDMSKVVIDKGFVKQLIQYERDVANKNQDHVEFLSGNLLGTPPFRFYPSDRNRLFDEILKIDDESLKDELHSLSTIDPDRKVSSDVFNLTYTWILHALHKARLSQSDRTLGQMSILKIAHYRFLGSLMAHLFRYPPDRAVAEATYASLSNKFSLKVYGSWAALIHARCEDILSNQSIHKKTIERYDDDDRILRLITDPQTRIREVVKRMVKVFYEIKDQPTRIRKTGSFVNMEGEMHIKDLIRSTSAYKRYLHDSFKDRNTFIRPELVTVIKDAMHTMPEQYLVDTLTYMADNYGPRGDSNIILLVDESLVQVFSFIQTNRSDFNRGINLATLLSRLRSLYTASRSSDASILKLRDLSFKIAKKAIRSTNQSLLSSVRTGVMLYLVLRTFTKGHYEGKGSLEAA